MATVRVAVAYFAKTAKSPVRAAAEALAASLRERGAQVDVIDAAKAHDVKLTGHHFLAVGCDVRAAFGGRLPPELKGFLANCGLIGGKRGMAFVTTALLGTSKTLLQLMKAMESEGLLLRTSEIFAKPDEATSAGKRLKIDGISVS
jgi:menaquinone-dependent protoporphyrinogen IX oxidase